MNPWTMLGIPATSDARVIKSAYAKMLKVTRPDEKPDEFQRLHAAYQHALAIVSRQAPLPGTTPTPQIVVETVDNTSHSVEVELTTSTRPIESTASEPEPTDIRPPPTSIVHDEDPAAADPEVINPYQREYERLLQCCREILSDQSLLHDPVSWQFLASNRFLLDPNFSWHIGKAIFELFADHYLNYDGVYLRNGDSWPALDYLNQLFNWVDAAQNLRAEFGEHAVNALLPLINTDRDHNLAEQAIESLRGAKSVKRRHLFPPLRIDQWHFATDFNRLLAGFADAILILSVMAGFSRLIETLAPAMLGGVYNQYAVQITGIVFLLGTWLFECSRWQATPGMLAFGLRVTDTQFARLPYWKGLVRAAVLGASCFLHIFAIYINGRLNGKFMHDRAGMSYVVDYRRSAQEAREKNRSRGGR